MAMQLIHFREKILIYLVLNLGVFSSTTPSPHFTKAIPDGKHALVGKSIVVVFVQSPGHPEVADLDCLIAGDEAIPAGDVAVHEAHFVEIFESASNVETHLRQPSRIHFLRCHTTAFRITVTP